MDQIAFAVVDLTTYMLDTHNLKLLTRRQLLAVAAAGSLTATAGCFGDDVDVPDPVPLDDGQACDQCRMLIANHYGPVGQAYYLDETPTGVPGDREDGLTHFCSSWCTYTFVRKNEREDTVPAGIYITDYTDTDYELFEDAGATVISSHLETDNFSRADDLTYTVDSDVEGAMGASLIGFSAENNAESFQEEHGGTLLDHDDITLETVGSL